MMELGKIGYDFWIQIGPHSLLLDLHILQLSVMPVAPERAISEWIMCHISLLSLKHYCVCVLTLVFLISGFAQLISEELHQFWIIGHYLYKDAFLVVNYFLDLIFILYNFLNLVYSTCKIISLPPPPSFWISTSLCSSMLNAFRRAMKIIFFSCLFPACTAQMLYQHFVSHVWHICSICTPIGSISYCCLWANQAPFVLLGTLSFRGENIFKTLTHQFVIQL